VVQEIDMKYWMLSGLLMVGLGGASFSASAAELYVSNGSSACSDSTTRANNTASSPWCTIGRAAWGSTTRSSPNAAEAAQAGDTVYVDAGTYTVAGSNMDNAPTYDPVNAGTSDSNRIIFKGVGTVVLRYSSGRGPMIGATSVDGVGTRSDYITWDGFTIYDADAPQWTNSGDSSVGNARCSYVIGCVLQNNTFYGNLSTGAGNNYAAIWLAGNGYGGSGGSMNVVRNNTIKNYLNFGTEFHHNAPAIMTYGTWDSIIEHNDIENCGAGIHIKGYINRNNTIRRNLIYSGGAGIVLGTTTGTHRVYQNVVRNSRGGVKFQNHGEGFKGNYYVVNNTFVNNGVDNDESSVGAYSLHVSGVTGLEGVYIQNNIHYRNAGSTAVGASWWFWDAWGVTHLDNNVYYQVTRYKRSATDYSTLASWRSAIGGCPGAGNDCSSITADPQFTNAGTHDYRLQAGSPANNLGVDVLDLNGNSSVSDVIPAGAFVPGTPTPGRQPIGTPGTTPRAIGDLVAD
jgi:hypothetical protein